MSRDTWNGDVNNPLSLNRWMYVEGNPINYVDPSGNSKVSFIFADYVDDYSESNKDVPHWTTMEISNVNTALGRIAWAYANAYNQESRRRALEECDPAAVFVYEKIDPFKAFFGVHGGRVTFKWKSYIEGSHWGRTQDAQNILIFKNIRQGLLTTDRGQRFITHEMGHAFENAYLEVNNTVKPGRTHVSTNNQLNNRSGFAGGFLDWQWSDSPGEGEIFGDMFVGWVFNSWAPPPLIKPDDSQEYKNQNQAYLSGLDKSKAMREYMPIWVYDTIENR